MGTVILEYARTVGAIPQHYFQAVGSGTGAIAAWEASIRLLRSGRFDGDLPRLHLVQNAPFTPIHDAWTHGIPEAEGIPTGPEGGAALSALTEAIETERVKLDDAVLLNITGNEDALLKRDYTIHRLKPWLTLRPGEVSKDGMKRLEPYFRTD